MDSLINGHRLLINSDRLAGAAMSDLLGEQGYQVCWVPNESSAIKSTRQGNLDLVICGEWIEGEMGSNVVGRVIEKNHMRETSVILGSKSQSAGVIQRNHELGSAMHLKEPIEFNLMIQLVERLIEPPRREASFVFCVPGHAPAAVMGRGPSQVLA